MVLGPWDPGPYWFARFALLKGVGVVYLLAFLVAARQFRPLAGEDGLLPLGDYVDHSRFRDSPSLFHFLDDDTAVAAAGWTGVALSVLAVVGVPAVFGVVGHAVVWTALWVLYLSFVNAGQRFYGFGWESMLLESGFLAIFLGPVTVAAPVAVTWLFRWVLFRNMFGAGLIKLRGDDCWRDLTCLDYHYETQPMPNPVSWFAHHLSDRVHRVGVAVNHVAELAIPFLYFAPQPFAAVAGVATVLFQAWLMVTGNFAWLNALTLVLAFSTFSDPLVAGVLPVDVPTAAVASLPVSFQVAGWLVVAVVVALSYYPVKNMVSSEQAMNAVFDPLHLVNTYGAFGSITRTRYEIIVEGTDDATVGPDTEWKPYAFPGKPDDPERRPPQVAPYHHRLGWQLWFAAMSPSPRRHPWFVNLLAKLLDGDDGVESLLREDPFPDDPPEHVRAVRYRYEFTTPEERSETGCWWNRERVGTYFGPVSRDDDRFRRTLRRLGWDAPEREESDRRETSAAE
ncbi:lipase maturation factor family protein [Halomicrococcus sp. NG-SE-24]|uniref:lipase maturation factor family protein n=1 Tax=Halomicrococcus sp. NG-SE-24 TaxID=3436928 RepID=UPI003D9842C5